MEAGPPENGGCPDKDTDKDGIVDRLDKCPEEAGPPERQGCPIHDKDGDGIADENDKCPDEAEDKDGFQDEDGCPDPDNDGDGIPDVADKCPNEPETKNGYQDDDGCPDEVPAPVKKFTGVIPGIEFRRNSADIKGSSFPLLKEAVKVLKDYPEVRLEISGHTSNEGKREFNMKLSQERAASVKAFLVSAGVDPTRVSTVGYGPDKPIEDNGTKAGREKNRRIEFRLLSPEEKVEPPPPPPPAEAPKGKKGKGKAKAEPPKTEGEPGAAPTQPPAPAEKPAAKPKKKPAPAPEPEGDPSIPSRP
jgi:OOP family OmpA-OmpF porin